MRLFLYALFLAFGLALIALVGITQWPYSDQQTQLMALLLPDSSDPTACPAPCWYGINTDETPHRQTTELILTLPKAENTGLMEWQFSTDGTYQQGVRLENGRDIWLHPQGVRLGDVLVALGKPSYQTNGNAYDDVSGMSSQYLQFFYEDQRVVVTVLLPYDGQLSPLTPVRQISYPTGPFPKPDGAHQWNPYVRMENYPLYGYNPFLELTH